MSGLYLKLSYSIINENENKNKNDDEDNDDERWRRSYLLLWDPSFPNCANKATSCISGCAPAARR
jgi:aspartyl/asparaginyl beta-hydroxylase (cupin superfamily)